MPPLRPWLLALALALPSLASAARPKRQAALFDSVAARRRGRGRAARGVSDVFEVGDRLDRYALALAATEPLREARDAALTRSLGRGRVFVLRTLKRKTVCARAGGSEAARDAPRQNQSEICAS